MSQTSQEGVERVVENAPSVLLLSPSMVDAEDGVCVDLMRPGTADQQNVLWISYTESPDRQVGRWRQHTESQPGNVGVISVGDATRSMSAVAESDGDASGVVETVASPTDLTGLGITVGKHLDRWSDDGRQTVVCFDSLTAMLQYVDLETTYKFLHILVGRLYANDARAHFHMDPGAHDDRTVESVVSLVDAVIELDEGGMNLRTR